MSVNRNLHLNDKNTTPKNGNFGFDKLYKIRQNFEKISWNIKKPPLALAVDEPLITFKEVYPKLDDKNAYLSNFDMQGDLQAYGHRAGTCRGPQDKSSFQLNIFFSGWVLKFWKIWLFLFNTHSWWNIFLKSWTWTTV